MVSVDCDPERIWKIVETNRQNMLPPKSRSSDSSPNFMNKLYDLYVEHASEKTEKGQLFRSSVNLLKRVDDLTLVSLLLNLFDDEKGYSIVLCSDSGNEFNEIYLPYEESYIFHYLDNQQIPPVILEILLKTKYIRYLGGFVICEVRDYRNHFLDAHVLLLRPTSETFSTAVNEMTLESNCSEDEKFLLESHTLLASQSPVCLDPSTDVACVNNRLCYNQLKYSCHSVKQYLHRRSHATRAKKFVCTKEESNIHEYFKQNNPHYQGCRKFSESWKLSRVKVAFPASIDLAFKEISQLVKPFSVMQPQLKSQRHTSYEQHKEKICYPHAAEVLNTSIDMVSPARSSTGNHEVVILSEMPDVAPPLNPQPLQPVNKWTSKNPPPLNVWHHSKVFGQNKLPKLHPLVNEQKMQQTFVNLFHNMHQTNQSSVTMPQLHRIPGPITGSSDSQVREFVDVSPELKTRYYSSKDTSETLKQLVQAHKKLAQSQAELSDPKFSTLPSVSCSKI